MSFSEREATRTASIEQVEKVSIEGFRPGFEALYDRFEEGEVPDVIYCVDTMGRPLAAGVKPLLEGTVVQEECPDIRFVAPHRELDVKVEDLVTEEETREWCDIFEETHDKFLESLSARLEDHYLTLLYIALHADISVREDIREYSLGETVKVEAGSIHAMKLLQKIRENVDEYYTNYLAVERVKAEDRSRVRGTGINEEKLNDLSSIFDLDKIILKRMAESFISMLLRMEALFQADKGKEVLIVDDYTNKGQTAMIFAVLSKLLPDIRFEYFSAITAIGFIDQKFGNLQRENGFPTNFDHCLNFDFISGKSVSSLTSLPYSEKVWRDDSTKQAMTGVTKSPDSPTAKRFEQRDGKAMKVIRDKFRTLAEDVVESRKREVAA